MRKLDYARKGMLQQQRPPRTLSQKLDRIGFIAVLVIVSVIYGGLGLLFLAILIFAD